MIRWLLLISGFMLLWVLQWLHPISLNTQSLFFLTGIVVLGVPHGAADLLVATRQATDSNQSFKTIPFFINYLGRLIVFAGILCFFPLTGNLLFIVFAAYHFGETDLYLFSIRGFAGKLFVVAYGLLILGVILLHHFEEVKPLFQLFESGKQYTPLLNWIDMYRYSILSLLALLFFAASFYYFTTNSSQQQQQGLFLVQFALILFILYQLPMMLGFSFYFIVWHSVLSLRNIIQYLRKDGLFSVRQIAKKIGFYSTLAMVGIMLFGFGGFMFVSRDTVLVYVFLGLAVLTAPHMQIMHNMYQSLRRQYPFHKSTQ